MLRDVTSAGRRCGRSLAAAPKVVRDLLAGLTADLARAMALAGVTSVSGLAHLAAASRDRQAPPSAK